MKPHAAPSFYDIEPLASFIEAGIPLLTPNYRLARTLKLAWGQRLCALGIGSWETPLIMSLEQWWLHCQQCADPWQETPMQLLSEQQELALWLHCIQAHPHSAALLRPRSAARLARDAYHNLLLWQHNRADTSLFQGSADCALFLQWRGQFEKLLAQKSVQVLPALVAQLGSTVQHEKILLLEFDELPPLYAATLRQQATDVQEYKRRGALAQCSLQPCGDAEQELHSAALWTQQKLRDDPAATVGILLADVGAQRLRLERHLRRVVHGSDTSEGDLGVNFSAGVPLATTPPVATALDILSLQEGDIDVQLLVKLLHSRYRNSLQPEAELQLIRRLFRRERLTIGQGELRYFCKDLALGEHLLQLAQRRELRAKYLPSRWAELFGEVLQLHQWPGSGPLDSREFQQLEHWYRCLQTFAGLDLVSQPMSYNNALNLLRQTCSAAIFQVQTAAAQIQVLGFLEAAGLQFDHLWLCGMSSNQWPSAPNPNPFVPITIQKTQGMPHADSQREYQFAQRILDHLRRSCRELVASYVHTDAGVEQRPGPMLADFSPRELPAPVPLALSWADCLQLPVLSEPPDQHANPLQPGEAESLRGGSSLLKDHSLCSFRGFVRNRLQVQPLPDLATTMTAAERGGLLHAALYELWGQLGASARLHELSDREREQLLEDVTRAAVSDFKKHHPNTVGAAFLDIEKSRLCHLLAKWLAIEMQRGEFVVQEREAECQLQLGMIQLHLRIDRVDCLPGGELFVIDYKSGDSKVAYWLGERPREPQLPLYSMAWGEQLAGIGFAVLAPGQLGWRGLAATAIGPGVSTDVNKVSRGEAADWAALQGNWQATLEHLAQQFIDGEAAVNPLDRNVSCTWCGLQAMCRIDEQEAMSRE